MSAHVSLEIEAVAAPDLLQLVRNGIEQERRRPKFGSAAMTSARRLARLARLEAAISAAVARGDA